MLPRSRLLPEVIIDCSRESGESSAADHPGLQPSCKARVGNHETNRKNILLPSNLCRLKELKWAGTWKGPPRGHWHCRCLMHNPSGPAGFAESSGSPSGHC